MGILRAWFTWWRRGRRALHDEMRTHIELEVERLVSEGLSSEEAYYAARHAFGNLTLATEESRAVWHLGPLERWWSDARFAVRLLRRSPGFTLAAAATLAIGIGSTTTVYSWVRSALLQPIPGAPRPHELVTIVHRDRAGRLSSTLSYPDFADYRAGAKTLAGAYAVSLTAANLSVAGGAERVFGAVVAGDFFEVLGTTAARGRTFGAEEGARAAGPAVVVVSDALWRGPLGGDPAVVGRTITLNGLPHAVIGVMPAGFVGGEPGIAEAFWAPLARDHRLSSGPTLDDRGSDWLETYARLKPGVSVTEASAELGVIASRIGRLAEPPRSEVTALARPLWQAPGGSAEVLLPLMAILGAATVLMLALASANVANLLLTRSAGRQHEMAVRLALGAGRSRIVGQLLVESVILSALGGAGGLALSHATVGLLMAFVPPTGALPIHLSLGLDWSAFGFAGAVSLLVAVAVGLAPAASTLRAAVAPALDAETPRTSGSRRGARVSQGLVVVQVALSTVLLVGAGLFLRSLAKAAGADPGFAADRLLVASVDLEPGGHTAATGRAFYTRLVDRVEALPGVESASLGRRVPVSQFGRSSTIISVDGYLPGADESMEVPFDVVAAGYFGTLGIPVTRGREFGPEDSADRPAVAVVNEVMARRFWAGRDPIGATFRRGSRTYAVVGVSRTVRNFAVNEPPRAAFSLPVQQAYSSEMHLFVRVSGGGDPVQLGPSLRAAVSALDPNLPLFALSSMREHLRFAFFVQRVGSSVLGVVGVLALVLAGVGLYGVVSYAVWQRLREFGVRLAFGATPVSLGRLVVRQGLRLLGIGLPLGLAGALALGAAARSQLFGVGAADPLALGGASLLLAAVVLVAAGIPAWRAGRLDAVRALRHQ